MKKPKQVYATVTMDVTIPADAQLGRAVLFEPGEYYSVLRAPDGWFRDSRNTWSFPVTEESQRGKISTFLLREYPYDRIEVNDL